MLPLVVSGMQLREQPFGLRLLCRRRYRSWQRRGPGQDPVMVIAPQLGHVLISLGSVDSGELIDAERAPVDSGDRVDWVRMLSLVRSSQLQRNRPVCQQEPEVAPLHADSLMESRPHSSAQRPRASGAGATRAEDKFKDAEREAISDLFE
jgi:hypothetical protein